MSKQPPSKNTTKQPPQNASMQPPPKKCHELSSLLQKVLFYVWLHEIEKAVFDCNFCAKNDSDT